MKWGGTDVVVIAQRLASVLNKWSSVKKCIPSDSYYEVSMESLAEDQLRAVSNILDRLSLTSYEEIEKVKVSTRAIGRYKRELTPKELGRIECILKDVLVEYGYK